MRSFTRGQRFGIAVAVFVGLYLLLWLAGAEQEPRIRIAGSVTGITLDRDGRGGARASAGDRGRRVREDQYGQPASWYYHVECLACGVDLPEVEVEVDIER